MDDKNMSDWIGIFISLVGMQIFLLMLSMEHRRMFNKKIKKYYETGNKQIKHLTPRKIIRTGDLKLLVLAVIISFIATYPPIANSIHGIFVLNK